MKDTSKRVYCPTGIGHRYSKAVALLEVLKIACQALWSQALLKNIKSYFNIRGILR